MYQQKQGKRGCQEAKTPSFMTCGVIGIATVLCRDNTILADNREVKVKQWYNRCKNLLFLTKIVKIVHETVSNADLIKKKR